MSQMSTGATATVVSSRAKRPVGFASASGMCACGCIRRADSAAQLLICLDEDLWLVLVDTAVAAVPALKVDDRLVQVAAAEIGPERPGDVHLGVGDLPQKEVRYPHLAAGADEEIG